MVIEGIRLPLFLGLQISHEHIVIHLKLRRKVFGIDGAKLCVVVPEFCVVVKDLLKAVVSQRLRKFRHAVILRSGEGGVHHEPGAGQRVLKQVVDDLFKTFLVRESRFFRGRSRCSFRGPGGTAGKEKGRSQDRGQGMPVKCMLCIHV